MLAASEGAAAVSPPPYHRGVSFYKKALDHLEINFFSVALPFGQREARSSFSF